MRWIFPLLFGLLLASGCSVVSNNRVFPKLTWYWNYEAVDQRQERQRMADRNELLNELAKRDTQILDLAVVGQNFVNRWGRERAWETVLYSFSILTGNVPPAKASDILWVKDQPRRVQDLSWLIAFRDDWEPAPKKPPWPVK